MKVISIVGARPEFIQSTPLSKALRKECQELLVHTGQHYDYRMSQTFFDELGIPAPDYNLEVGSNSHAQQTAEILVRLEPVFLKEKPDIVIIRGDTNSTLAGALAASKLHIPIAHVEAGERSFNRQMPEEINRLVADRISDWHFCASHAAVNHLAAEGIIDSVHWVGDVMFDAILTNLPLAREKSNILQSLELNRQKYVLVTVHRAANTDDPERLSVIVNQLNQMNEKIIFPAHPRTRNAIQQLSLEIANHVSIIDPVGYFDMMMLEENARLIVTDSGGVQREAYMLCVPCLTLRDETEWTETIETGWNQLVDLGSENLTEIWHSVNHPLEHPPIFGDGTAGEKVVNLLFENINR
jgi:UDP-N-acetylglucosamine 2-epimerase